MESLTANVHEPSVTARPRVARQLAPIIKRVNASSVAEPFEILGSDFGDVGGVIRFLIIEPERQTIAFEVTTWASDRIVVKLQTTVFGRVLGLLQVRAATGQVSNAFQIAFPGTLATRGLHAAQ